MIDGPRAFNKTPYMKEYSAQIMQNWKIFAEIFTR